MDNQKIAVVIGGGQTLGAFLCKGLAENGYVVAVADLNLKNAEQIADEIQRQGKKAQAFFVDASKEESVVRLATEINQTFGAVDLMVYSAGIAKAHPITEFPLSDFMLSVNVNLVGYFICAKTFSQMMINAKKAGRIIQINSKSGKVGSKHNTGYSAAKFGGVGLTQSLALDLAEHGITVNSLMLGNLLKSPMFQSLIPQYAQKLSIPVSKVEQVYIDKVPLKRGCEYQDVLNVLLFYASEKASYCTGQSINITGGQVMF